MPKCPICGKPWVSDEFFCSIECCEVEEAAELLKRDQRLTLDDFNRMFNDVELE